MHGRREELISMYSTTFVQGSTIYLCESETWGKQNKGMVGNSQSTVPGEELNRYHNHKTHPSKTIALIIHNFNVQVCMESTVQVIHSILLSQPLHYVQAVQPIGVSTTPNTIHFVGDRDRRRGVVTKNKRRTMVWRGN